jgi:hypothetical protein
MSSDAAAEQLATCRRFGVPPVESPEDFKVGISRNVLQGIEPLNALRHMPAGDTTGWYIWAGGEPEADPDFFVPLHVAHVGVWCPQILPYLALPPGFRVLLGPGYEDVWDDPALLQVIT